MNTDTATETATVADWVKFRDTYAAPFFDALMREESDAEDLDLFRSMLDLPGKSGRTWIGYECPAWVYDVFGVAYPECEYDANGEETATEFDWALFFDVDLGKFRRDVVEYVFDHVDNFGEQTGADLWELCDAPEFALTLDQVDQVAAFFSCYADRFDLELYDARQLDGRRPSHFVAGRVYHGSPNDLDRYAVELGGDDAAEWVARNAPDGSDADQVGALAYLVGMTRNDATRLGISADYVAPSADAFAMFADWADANSKAARQAHHDALARLNDEAGRVPGLVETDADETGFGFQIPVDKLAAILADSHALEYWATVNEGYHVNIARDMFAIFLADGHYLAEWVAADRPEFEPETRDATRAAYSEALTRAALDHLAALLTEGRQFYAETAPEKRRAVIFQRGRADGVWRYVVEIAPSAWEWGDAPGPAYVGQHWEEWRRECRAAFADPAAAILAAPARTRLGVTSDANSALSKAVQS